MRGILGWGVHLPYRRLDRTTIAAVAGTGGGKGTRTVASYDEDATTMAVEAARLALRSAPSIEPGGLVFTTTAPAYFDKTNATTVHAALRLRRCVPAYDAVGSVRSAMGALQAGLTAPSAMLVVSGDLRGGLPGGADESAGGDAGAALLVGGDDDGPVLAELVGWASATEEFLDRWRTPGAVASKQWEERFGETRYLGLGADAWRDALGAAGLTAADVDHVVVAGPHDRAATSLTKSLKLDPGRVVDRLAASVGNVGAAQPALLLAAALEKSQPGQVIALVCLSDGADVAIFRTTEALAAYHPQRPVADQVASGAPIAYGRFLAWRGFLPVEPPRRPEPARPSATASSRGSDWKFGLVDPESGPKADAIGAITTFTVDKLAYSPSPPVVFAVVDFEGGGRMPVELTDVDVADIAVGMRVEMTFRRLFTADGIANYFWKARPVREIS